jgi:hypothetical protein
MKKKIHIKVQSHTIKNMNEVSHSDNTPGDYQALDTIIEVSIDDDPEDIDEVIEYEVDERLRYDYDLGYIYDNNLVEWYETYTINEAREIALNFDKVDCPGNVYNYDKLRDFDEYFKNESPSVTEDGIITDKNLAFFIQSLVD